jgi:diketogulonate reductase-like aldo/keto reductase
MKAREFGSTDSEVPVIGEGTWRMEGDDRSPCVRAIRRALDRGMRHIDTAEMYGSGAVEEIVGEALAGRRDDAFLASKVLPQNASKQGTIEACERSLKRLRAEFLDLYLLHWPGPHPLEETIEAFEVLVEQGKIRAYGVSNFDADELEEAVRLAGPGRIACNQVLYHLGERTIEHGVIPRCEAHGVAVVAYSPFGSGQFPGPRSRGGKVLHEVASDYGASPRQVALAFLTRRASVFAIPKASRPEHVDDNAGGAFELGDDDIARIDRNFPLGKDRGLPVL